MITQSISDHKALDPALALRSAQEAEGGIELKFNTERICTTARFRLMKYKQRHGPADVILQRTSKQSLLLIAKAEAKAARQERAEKADEDRYARVWPTRRKRMASAHSLTDASPMSDFLMFVGRCYYTVESFVEEAKRLGVSKRVAGIPDGMKLGESRVFLAAEGPKGQIVCPCCMGHGEKPEFGLTTDPTQKCPFCKGRGHIRQHIVFGYFVPTRVDLIVRDEEADALRQEIVDKDIHIVKMADARLEPARGCGHRHAGAVYVVSNSTDFESLAEDAALVHRAADIEGGIVVFRRPVIYKGLHCLGIRHFDPASVGIEIDRPQRQRPTEIGITLEGTACRGTS